MGITAHSRLYIEGNTKAVIKSLRRQELASADVVLMDVTGGF
jgi:hypothetical protein